MHSRKYWKNWASTFTFSSNQLSWMDIPKMITTGFKNVKVLVIFICLMWLPCANICLLNGKPFLLTLSPKERKHMLGISTFTFTYSIERSGLNWSKHIRISFTQSLLYKCLLDVRYTVCSETTSLPGQTQEYQISLLLTPFAWSCGVD